MNTATYLLAFTLAIGASKDIGADKQAKPMLSDKEHAAMDEEAHLLAGQGKKGAALLAKKIRAGPYEWKTFAIMTLRDLGPDAEPALDALIEEVRAKDSDHAMIAIYVIGEIGPSAKRAVPDLIALATRTSNFSSDRAPSIIDATLETVREISPADLPRLGKALVPGLLEAIRTKRREQTRQAIRLLTRLGPDAKPALPTLKASIGDLPDELLGDVLPIFLASGEDGMKQLVEAMLDPKTTTEMKLALMEGYRDETDFPPSSLRLVRAFLAEKNDALRLSALQALRSVRAKEVIPLLVELIGDKEIVASAEKRRLEDPFIVALALGNQGKSAVGPLTKLLGHELPLVRYQATHAFSGIGKDGVEAIPALEKRLDDEDALIGLEAANAILNMGKPHEKAIETFEKSLRVDAKLLTPALRRTRELGSAAKFLFPALKKLALEANDVQVQLEAFECMRRMETDPKAVVQVWAKLVKDDRLFLDACPSEQIRKFPLEAKSVVPVVLKYLHEGDFPLRGRVMDLITDMGPHAKEAIPHLIKLVEEKDAIPVGAIRALAAIGPEAKPAIPAIVRYLDKIPPRKEGIEGPIRKEDVISSIGDIGPGAVEAVPCLIQLVPEYSEASRALGKIGPSAKHALPALEKIRKDGRRYLKPSAAFALIKITGKTEPYVTDLVGMLQTFKSPPHRREVFSMLKELGLDARSALPALVAVLKEKTESERRSAYDFRSYAAEILAGFGSEAKAAVPDLITLVQAADKQVKESAVVTLGAIGPAAKDAIPALTKIANEDSNLRQIAEKALEKIKAVPGKS